MTELLTVAGITKRFNHRRVLEDVSFSVYSGEVLGLIGPNGSGKTTLFECLAGLLPVNSGLVRANQKELTPSTRKDTLFYLPDSIFPWAEQSVRWSLNFFCKLFKTSERKLESLIEPLRLGELMKARLGSLSKGERKRLLLGLALLTPHSVLMLDEPFDGLDLRQTRDVMSLLKEQTASGRALVLSIHQLSDAARVCDRLVLLSGGRVVGEGTLTDLQTKANLPGASVEDIFLELT